MDKRFISANEAKALLLDGEFVHTFRNPAGMMVGCDWDRKDIENLFDKHDGKIEIGGETCRRMGHGIVVFDNGSALFIEHDKEKLNQFDPIA